MRRSLLCLVLTFCSSFAIAEEGANQKYVLETDLSKNPCWSASVKIEVGGERLSIDPGNENKLPLSMSGNLSYEECVLNWSPSGIARSIRKYETAEASIQLEKRTESRQLPESTDFVLAEIRGQEATMNGASKLLTRNEYDLINISGNTLAIQRLLPEREIEEGENWDHSKEVLGPLLGLDHIAVCEVSSVVVGEKRNHVQIRMAGTVHGTVDGAPTEMDLRGAYLYDMNLKRISKFNLAVKELRSASIVVPGLDIVAKVYVALKPSDSFKTFDTALVEKYSNINKPIGNELRFKTSKQDCQFRHNKNWYISGEKTDGVLLSYQKEGEMLAHCKLSTLPARSEGRFTTLEQFEREIRESLGENLQKVTASTQWKTEQGYECLGVVALGKSEGIPFEWRYYLLSADSLNRASMAFTIEQSKIKQFDDSDRSLVESVELLPTTATAKKKSEMATK